MDRDDYFRASKLNYDIERNEEAVTEITSWLESERFEGVVLSFVNDDGVHHSDSVMLEDDIARDVLEYARRKIIRVLRKQNQEFKKL